LGNIKGAYEKQMRTLMNDNEQLKQHIQQTDRTISQLKKENEELNFRFLILSLIQYFHHRFFFAFLAA